MDLGSISSVVSGKTMVMHGGRCRARIEPAIDHGERVETHEDSTDAGSSAPMRRKVAVLLPAIARSGSMNERYALELEALAPLAELIEVDPRRPADIVAAARDADAIITSWGVAIDQPIIAALERCVVIGVGSVGVDMVDIAAATAAGIVVTNVPDVFIEEVADHAMMLLLAAVRHVKATDAMVHNGAWRDGRPLLNRVPRLMGRTLGLYGFGSVARCVARRAAGFGLRLIAHDPYVSELDISAAGAEPVSFQELLANADYLSLHTPLNAETRHSIDCHAFAQMRPGVVIVNTARGGVIHESDLAEALQSGQVSAAGLDVLEQEPPAPDNPLLAMANVIVTPHVASASTRMRPETRRRAAREVALVLRGRWPMSCVNPTVLPRTELERWQPYSMHRGPNR
jgi:D-3-phosphoglycerate dehydrogenase / 2-oxoglutarate reductase